MCLAFVHPPPGGNETEVSGAQVSCVKRLNDLVIRQDDIVQSLRCRRPFAQRKADHETGPRCAVVVVTGTSHRPASKLPRGYGAIQQHNDVSVSAIALDTIHGLANRFEVAFDRLRETVDIRPHHPRDVDCGVPADRRRYDRRDPVWVGSNKGAAYVNDAAEHVFETDGIAFSPINMPTVARSRICPSDVARH